MTREQTAAAVKDVVSRVEGLELGELLETDIEAIVAAARFKRQEMSYRSRKELIDNPPQAAVTP